VHLSPIFENYYLQKQDFFHKKEPQENAALLIIFWILRFCDGSFAREFMSENKVADFISTSFLPSGCGRWSGRIQGG
jgi:hypothetical protein